MTIFVTVRMRILRTQSPIYNVSTICDQYDHCSELEHCLQGLDMKSPAEEKSSLNVSPAERQEIEHSTQCQAKASKWHFLGQEGSLGLSVAKFYASKVQLKLC